MLNIILGLIYMVGVFTSHYVWRKYKDKDYLWFFWFMIIAILVRMVDYFINNIFHTSLEIIFISNTVLLIADFTVVVTGLVILFKFLRRR